MTNSNLLVSIVRTVIPAIVAFLIAQAARVGLDIPLEDLTGVIEVVVLGGYYSLIRVLEQKVPGFGWLLGLPAQPHYEVEGE